MLYIPGDGWIVLDATQRNVCYTKSHQEKEGLGLHLLIGTTLPS